MLAHRVITGTPVVAWANDAGLVGHDDGLNAVTQAELVEDPGDVRLGGGLADKEGACEFAVGQSFGDELEYLELARGESRELCRRGVGTRSVHELLDETAGNGGRDEGVAGDVSDRGDE